MLILANNREAAVAQIRAQLRRLKLRLGLDALLWAALTAGLVWFGYPIPGALAGATGALYLKWAWGRYKRARGNMLAGLQFLDMVHSEEFQSAVSEIRDVLGDLDDAPAAGDAAPRAPDDGAPGHNDDREV